MTKPPRALRFRVKQLASHRSFSPPSKWIGYHCKNSQGHWISHLFGQLWLLARHWSQVELLKLLGRQCHRRGNCRQRMHWIFSFIMASFSLHSVVCCQCLWGAGLDDMITMVVVQGRMRKYQRSECFTYIILPAYNKYLKNASILIDIPGKRSAKSLTGFSGELGGTEWREEMQESLYQEYGVCDRVTDLRARELYFAGQTYGERHNQVHNRKSIRNDHNLLPHSPALLAICGSAYC